MLIFFINLLVFVNNSGYLLHGMRTISKWRLNLCSQTRSCQRSPRREKKIGLYTSPSTMSNHKHSDNSMLLFFHLVNVKKWYLLRKKNYKKKKRKYINTIIIQRRLTNNEIEDDPRWPNRTWPILVEQHMWLRNVWVFKL